MTTYLPTSRECPEVKVRTDILYCNYRIGDEVYILSFAFLGALIPPPTMDICLYPIPLAGVQAILEATSAYLRNKHE